MPARVKRGCRLTKFDEAARVRESQSGGFHEKLPKADEAMPARTCTKRTALDRTIWTQLPREKSSFIWGTYGRPRRIFQEIGRDSRTLSGLSWTPQRGVPTIIAMRTAGLVATRRSLVDRLENWDDRKHWQEFFDTYWKLIYSAARKSGLTDAEAQEVVQETVITVAKKVGQLRYDPAIGSFKGWLLHITRWRIADQFRKREPGQNQRARSQDDRQTATIERVPDAAAIDLDALWETEWQENLFAAAIARVKKKVAPKQFQIFDCYVRKEWPAQKVAAELRVNVGQVYLARHRVTALLKKEIKALEKHA